MNGARWLTASALIGVSTSLLTAPLTARALGVADRGVLAALVSVQMSLIPAIAPGLPGSVRRYAFEHEGAGEHLLGSIRRASLLAVLPVIALTWLLREHFYLSKSAALATLLFLLTACVIPERQAISSLLLARGEPFAVGLLAMMPNVVALVATPLLFVLDELSLASALSVATVGFLSQVPVSLLALRRSPPRVPREGTDRGKPSNRWLLFCLAVVELSLPRLDLLLVGALATTELLGQYAIAAIPATVSVAVAQAVLGACLADGGRSLEDRLERASTLVPTAVMSVWVLSAVPFALLVRPVFGGEFVGAIKLLPVAALYSTGYCYAYLSCQTLVLIKGRLLRVSLPASIIVLIATSGGVALVARTHQALIPIPLGLGLLVASTLVGTSFRRPHPRLLIDLFLSRRSRART